MGEESAGVMPRAVGAADASGVAAGAPERPFGGVRPSPEEEEEARRRAERRLDELERSRSEEARVERHLEESRKDKEKEKESPSQEVFTLRTEIEDIRDDLGHYISELDRRRHEVFDLKEQFRKHREIVVAVGVGLLGLVGALVAWRVKRASRPLSLAERLNERINENLSERVKDQIRKHDLLDTLGRAAIGVAAAAAATAVKGVVDKRMERASAR